MTFPQHDTHFHLDLLKNPQQVLEEIEEAKVYTIAVTNLPAVFDNTLQMTKASKYVRAALGFHPELASEYKKQLDLFVQKLPETRYIGEIGLDNYNKSLENYAAQKMVFEKIIEACHSATGKILTVHSRRAEKEVLAMVGPRFSGKVILHWYSGAAKYLEIALSHGFYFSVNHAMTQTDNGKKIIGQIPLDRMLLETDGPFIQVEGKPSTPLIVHHIIKQIEYIKGKDDVGKSIYQNFRSLLTDNET